MHTHTHTHTQMGEGGGRQSGEKEMIEETKPRDVLIERCGGSMNPIARLSILQNENHSLKRDRNCVQLSVHSHYRLKLTVASYFQNTHMHTAMQRFLFLCNKTNAIVQALTIRFSVLSVVLE